MRGEYVSPIELLTRCILPLNREELEVASLLLTYPLVSRQSTQGCKCVCHDGYSSRVRCCLPNSE